MNCQELTISTPLLGDTPWLEEECEEIKSHECPAGWVDLTHSFDTSCNLYLYTFSDLTLYNDKVLHIKLLDESNTILQNDLLSVCKVLYVETY